MKRKEYFIVSSVIFYTITLTLFGFGFYHLFAYKSFSLKPVNAFAGRNTYNCFINTIKAAAYFVLGGSSLILASVFETVSKFKK